ncbi:MAG: hypothetical protein A2381_04720 [Bdellovibrionales bacterium RIFOXYB1_FULL_37_110]|nr:MAG: hypothetical protein A2181_01150 [Bdellovibrionales bacterium RIFOXYA1_FULL_38_20]OFZ50488.1 MAG: hypothetical protein A2417_10700 [Bdellovibrionales bacterium RIFOXYC1_FULL_37_79]OFZ60759.1 MAG: hypothetical protein A2381_04720 [Bdellovibrionales bacterium RIFOXYB1_FULL_37_110]OFZ64473.1 MAG: hypothetical protein A2577_08685 [Bdellovibrionales bacterium RIFOXYD1_FULL_36_51]
MRTIPIKIQFIDKSVQFDLVKAQNSTDHWFRHLEVQNIITEFIDRQFLYTDPDWTNATSVLDLGCGHGFYLNQLAQKFNEKKYLGVDIDQKAIEYAQNNAEKNVKFCCQDLYHLNLNEKFDVCFAKLLVQHLKKPQAFLEKMSEQLNENGVVYLIDGHDDFKRFFPQLPSITSIYQRLGEKYKQIGANRKLIYDIPLLASNCGFDIECENIVAGSSGRNFSHETLYEMLLINCIIIQQTFGVDVDLAQVQTELHSWYQHPQKFGGIGLHFLKLRKTRKLH